MRASTLIAACAVWLGCGQSDDASQQDDDGDGSSDASEGGDSADSGVDDGPTGGTSMGDDAGTTGDPNTPPEAGSDLCAMLQDHESIQVDGENGLLVNDEDPDGDEISAVAQEGASMLGAEFTVEADGAFTYRPSADSWGQDRVTYTIEDAGGATATGTVDILVHPVIASLSSMPSGSGGFVINGERPSDHSAVRVGPAGDVNADGLADIIVGADLATGTGELSGRVYVVFGKADRMPVALTDVTEGTGGFAIEAEAAGDGIGLVVHGIGDINDDGFDDVSIGLPERSPGGRVYVVYGKADGDAVDLSAVAEGTGGFVLDGEAEEDFFGWSVAGVGDFDGDGTDDFAVGAVGHSTAAPRAGRVYVLFGGSEPPSLADALAGDRGLVLDGEVELDRAGASLAEAGDVDGDGVGDLFIGADGANPNGNNAGRGYVVFGRPGSAPVSLTTIVEGEGGFAINGEGENDIAGYAVAAGRDVDGDGLDDLLIGAFQADTAVQQTGRAYVVYGKADGGEVELSAVATGEGGFAIDGEAYDDALGFSVALVADLDGDDKADALVGAPAWDGSEDAMGRVYAVLRHDVSPVTLSTVAADERGFVLEGEPVNGHAGHSIAALGDVDGDGREDFVIGAPGVNSAQGGAVGRAYVVFGRVRSPVGPGCGL